jgi:hypothetical protein
MVWAIGLALCAAAAWFAFLSQWKFQIAASWNYQNLAKQFFNLDAPEPMPPADSKLSGVRWRDWFWGLWIGPVAAFVIGSIAATLQLP